MKKINVLMAASFVAAFVLGAAFVGTGALAQTTTNPTPLACVWTLPSVPAGSPATLTATGGTGSYVWSGPGLVISNPTGTQFTVTYNAAGTYPVTVSSGTQTATCNVVVTAVEVIPPTPGLPNTGELE